MCKFYSKSEKAGWPQQRSKYRWAWIHLVHTSKEWLQTISDAEIILQHTANVLCSQWKRDPGSRSFPGCNLSSSYAAKRCHLMSKSLVWKESHGADNLSLILKQLCWDLLSYFWAMTITSLSFLTATLAPKRSSMPLWFCGFAKGWGSSTMSSLLDAWLQMQKFLSHGALIETVLESGSCNLIRVSAVSIIRLSRWAAGSSIFSQIHFQSVQKETSLAFSSERHSTTDIALMKRHILSLLLVHHTCQM